jgi:hypothetical protein
MFYILCFCIVLCFVPPSVYSCHLLLYMFTDHCHRMEIRFSKQISYHINSNLLPAHTEPWHEKSALISVTNRNSIIFFAPTSTTRYPDDFACEKKTPPRRIILSPNGTFPLWPVTEPFCARAHTKVQTPSTREDVCQFVRY